MSKKKVLQMATVMVLMTLLEGSKSLLDYTHKPEDEKPKFDDHVPSNLTVQQGDTAYLGCRIFNVGNQ